jgi:hypothetical protein
LFDGFWDDFLFILSFTSFSLFLTFTFIIYSLLCLINSI